MTNNHLKDIRSLINLYEAKVGFLDLILENPNDDKEARTAFDKKEVFLSVIKDLKALHFDSHFGSINTSK